MTKNITTYEKTCFKFFLKTPIKDLHDNEVQEITLSEPTQEVATNGIKLAQIVRKAQMQAFSTMKELVDSSNTKKDSVGEEVKPFYQREITDDVVKEIETEANGTVELFISSDVDPEKLFNTFKSVVCVKLKGGKRLATTNCDDKDRGLTSETFDLLDVNDKLHIIARYYSFFGYSSISASRNMSD